MRIGVVGCGNISGAYLETLRRFPSVDVVACTDLDPARARRLAERFGIPETRTLEDVIGADDIELILNLTPPLAHAPVARAALEAGKHVYGEKPLAVERAAGAPLVHAAQERGLRVGSAPDTFLGRAWQTARQLVDEGAIGRPLAGRANMLIRGHETWHPDPAFYYQPGGGPLLDMGPYYLTALVFLLGPVERVAALARAGIWERVVGSGPKAGESIQVDTETHVAGLVEHVSGAIVTLTTSFDTWADESSFELWGTEGTLRLPDPNDFDGKLALRDGERVEFVHVPSNRGPAEASRGYGLADLVAAQAEGRPHRANAELAFHVLDAMTGMLEASRERRYVELESRAERPAPLTETEVDGWRDAR